MLAQLSLVPTLLHPSLVPVCGAKVGGKLGRVQRQCLRVGLKVKKAATW